MYLNFDVFNQMSYQQNKITTWNHGSNSNPHCDNYVPERWVEFHDKFSWLFTKRFKAFYLICRKYRISANSFCRNYSFLNLTLCSVTFADRTYRCGNYSREETIQGRKLFAEVRYMDFSYYCIRYNIGQFFMIKCVFLPSKASIFSQIIFFG